MKTYTPAELRALADSRHTNPFFADQARAAMHYAANVLEAADAAVTAERQRAEQGAEQGDAKDAQRYRWLVGGNCVSDRLLDAYKNWDGCDGVTGFNAHIDAAILASKGEEK